MPWSVPFLLMTVVALPLLALISSRATRSAHVELPSRTALYIQLLVIQLVVGGLAALAAFGVDITTAWASRLEFETVGPATGLVVVALLGAVWLRRFRVSDSKVGHQLAPQSLADWSLWGAGMMVAAVVEEFAYRGVLFELSSRLFESWWLAAVGSAVLFGAAHASQGWPGGIASVLFALGLQGLVFHSGGLLLAIAVHLGYDLGIEVLARWLAAPGPAPDAE